MQCGVEEKIISVERRGTSAESVCYRRGRKG